MNYLIIMATFFSFSLLAKTKHCSVLGPKLIVKESSKVIPGHLFTFKDCNNKQIESIKRFISDFEGTLNKRTLQAETQITFSGVTNTKITTLDSLLDTRINKEKTWRFVESKFSGTNQRYLSVQENEVLTVRCNNCTNTGNKNVKIEIRNPIESRFKVSWSNTKLAARTIALFPLESLPVNNKGLLPSQFETRVVYDIRPEQFFTDRSKLVFYKTNRPKSKGEPVRFQDLTPVNLVQMGQPTTVVLKNNNLNLETVAIPGQSGKLGQRIRLKNPRTKKTIIGKVIHFNKVEVEL